MPRPRLARSKALIEGRDVKDPQRYRTRKEPRGLGPVGPPPKWFSQQQAAVWAQFVTETPGLNGSHRALLEIACVTRARLVAGHQVGVQALNLLRQCLGQMGATPADATKITMPHEPDDEAEESLFRRTH